MGRMGQLTHRFYQLTAVPFPSFPQQADRLIRCGQFPSVQSSQCNIAAHLPDLFTEQSFQTFADVDDSLKSMFVFTQ